MHHVCGVCVRDRCPNCLRSPRLPNEECREHVYPDCPHPSCDSRPLTDFYAVGGIGHSLHDAVRAETAALRQLLRQLDSVLANASFQT